ncbi:MAG: choloylglycine hydrolase [Lachnospiraceae bacterium]|nr:choloylglycine hydrolase [Lachnospiraceae bacterium]
MCTAATYQTRDHYFGRNLDLEFSYHETVTVTPRNKVFEFRHGGKLEHHYAMIGMAFVVGDYPLYYDATNEKGLSMAGLNFPGNAHYAKAMEGKDNVASFELIVWILGQCKNVGEAEKLLEKINVTDDAFSKELQPSPLHWMIADKDRAIVFEQTERGPQIYDNPFGVMTNNPTFDYHLLHIADYMNASADLPENRLAKGVNFNTYSRGMGGFGIPGDLSSASRFVKVAFTKMNSVSDDSESASISQFFKILGSVEQQKGCCRLGYEEDGNPICEYTIYSSCCNTDRGIYYYTTYENSQISAVDMHHEDLDGSSVVTHELVKSQQINYQN